MQLVEDDALERAEEIGRIGRGQNQRQLLRRREQDVRRVAALALPLCGRRIAGAGFDANRQCHLGDRSLQVAGDVDGERLERRDVERVQPAPTPNATAGGNMLASQRRGDRRCAQFHQARQESRQRLAGSGRCDQQHGTAGAGLCQKLELVAARRPTALTEPTQKRLGQQRSRLDCRPDIHDRRTLPIGFPESQFSRSFLAR